MFRLSKINDVIQKVEETKNNSKRATRVEDRNHGTIKKPSK